jgi:hypothetical protein
MTKANIVCKQYYEKECHICPLRPSCCRPVGPGREAYNAWTAECEELAGEILASH